MFEFHKDKEAYFRQQYENADQYVIPFITQHKPLSKDMRVLEVGCAEAGVLKAFIDKGLIGIGVELVAYRAALANQFLKDEIASGRAQILAKNIYDDAFLKEFKMSFDIIVLKDVIEHIHDQQKVMLRLKEFLKEDGIIFFGFPPWQMPFGGHQQICKNKFLSMLPYYHLLPSFLYRLILQAGGESKLNIDELLEVKETGISIERFERCVKGAGLKVAAKSYYLINPIYKYKFGLQPRKQYSIIAAIPWLRNFFTTCVYYLVSR